MIDHISASTAAGPGRPPPRAAGSRGSSAAPPGLQASTIPATMPALSETPRVADNCLHGGLRSVHRQGAVAQHEGQVLGLPSEKLLMEIWSLLKEGALMLGPRSPRRRG